VNTQRLFLRLQRFNTLLPALLTLLLLAVMVWEFLPDMRGGGRETVDPPADTAAGRTASGPGASATAVPLDIRTSHIDAGPNILVMKIVAPKEDGSHYVSKSTETRNLLFLNDGSDKAIWLFPDASQAITRLESLNNEDAKTPTALYLETEPRPYKDGSPSRANTHLVSPDGLRKRAIATELDQILSHRQHGQTLQLVYQKGKVVRVMKVSLNSFETLSDRVVATLSEVGK
jgi:hypothetical protein